HVGLGGDDVVDYPAEGDCNVRLPLVDAPWSLTVVLAKAEMQVSEVSDLQRRTCCRPAIVTVRAPFTGAPSARVTLTVPVTRPLVAAETNEFQLVDQISDAPKPPVNVPVPTPPSAPTWRVAGSVTALTVMYASVSTPRGTRLSSTPVAFPLID